ncbi:Mur ligase family protein [Lentilactobacillus sp. Marseille-Q4993]|uniref:bifunctional folylpolyglutamate synthase/dihydrofolate synthase n=1 Tax=Lentilactobacillus sp. Marseille-Q4993 TaxID=3039492 RepID=UPI0024BD51F5|nr:Mur ligase family protein [Lentilactobacillus sp. Marseille-Q4993]
MTNHYSEIPEGSLYNQGDRIGLLKKVLSELGNQDRQFKIIHVCGTNGKGSTATMIAKILAELGDKVGLFMSPVVGPRNSDICINFESISNREVRNIEHRVNNLPALKSGDKRLSPFEMRVIVAILYFASGGVDFAVLECGLGGELDATNAVFTTMYSIFTPISLDHLGILGDTLAEIATAKAKIIRPSNTTIVAPSEPGVVQSIIRKEALDKGSTLIMADSIAVTKNGNKVSATFGDTNYEFKFGLSGNYQQTNLRTVLAWFMNFIDRHSISQGPQTLLSKALGDLMIPGRFEEINNTPKIIVDGAHNPDGISSFKETVSNEFITHELIIVVGFLKDKNYVKSMAELATLNNPRFVITQPINDNRALAVGTLAETATNLGMKIAGKESNPRHAIDKAISLAEANTTIFCVGSFYLINPIRDYILNK